jgi:hypothetical protein
MPVTTKNTTRSVVPPVYVAPKARRDDQRDPSPLEEFGPRLAAALERAGWDIPGFDVEFQLSGENEPRHAVLSRILGTNEGGPFEIGLGMYGRDADDRPKTILNEATFSPGIRIEYQTTAGYGPVVDLAVATEAPRSSSEWPSISNAFMSSHRVPDKSDDPGTFVRYRPGPGDRLVPYTDGDRGRSPAGTVPADLSRPEIVDRTRKFLEGVAAAIEAAPAHDSAAAGPEAARERFLELVHADPVPAPEGTPRLHVWVEHSWASRISRGSMMERTEGTALPVRGYRLSATTTTRDGSRLPDDAWRSYNYASSDPLSKVGHVLYGPNHDHMPVAIDLKWADDIFVVDRAAYERHRDETFARMALEKPARTRMYDRELDFCVAEVARTMVPLVDYDGSFADPMHIVGRQLGYDEVSLPKPSHVEIRHMDDHRQIVLVETGGREVVASIVDGNRKDELVTREAEDLGRFYGTKIVIHVFPTAEEVDEPAAPGF